jgi:RNA polymerase sigma-70 factor, ECF subfamily
VRIRHCPQEPVLRRLGLSSEPERRTEAEPRSADRGLLLRDLLRPVVISQIFQGQNDPMTSAERTIDEDADRRLIEGLRSNNRESMAVLYDTYSSMAYGLALRTIGNPTEAEDVVQESFLALWRQAERLDPARGVRSYLLTIVHNKTVDRLRQKGRRPEAALELGETIPSKDEDLAESVARQSEGESVRAAMGSLPAEQRRAIEMTYFNGLTINEVASRTAVPIGTVKSRLRLALQHLRRNLAEAEA